MPVIDVNTSKVRSEGSKLGQVASQFSKSITQVYEARDSLGSQWSGQDAEKYKSKLDAFREPLDTLQKALKAYSEFIESSATAYEKQQQNIAEAI